MEVLSDGSSDEEEGEDVEKIKAREWLRATERVGNISGANERREGAARRKKDHSAHFENPISNTLYKRTDQEYLAFKNNMTAYGFAPRPTDDTRGQAPSGQRQLFDATWAGQDGAQGYRYSYATNKEQGYTHTRPSEAPFANNYTTLSHHQIVGRQGVPHDLPVFTGAVEDWPNFIAAFERTTIACGYSDDENISRLQHSLQGKARETVGHLLAFPAGLNEAMATLRARFGRPDLIVEATISKVRQLPTPRVERLESLVEFGYGVKRLLATVTASGLHNYMYDVSLLRELERKLPPVICIDWARHKRQLHELTIREFGSWCGKLADDLWSVVDVPAGATPGGLGDHQRTQHNPRFVSHTRHEPEIPRHNPRFVPHARPGSGHPPFIARVNTHVGITSTVPAKCVMCEGRCSTLADCVKFQESTVRVRRAVINSVKRCRKCLEFHRYKCLVNEECGIDGCGKLHHRLLHEKEDCSSDTPGRGALERAHVNTHASTRDGVLLRYLPVTVHAPRGRVETVALLDEGSTSSFMGHGLLDDLGLKGKPEPLCLQWTGHVTRKEESSVRLTVRISGRHSASPILELSDVHTVSELGLPAQTLSAQRLVERYEHLRGLPIESYEHAVPRLLIGIDNCTLVRPLESAGGKQDEPIAAKTPLGWVVRGPYSKNVGKENISLHAFHRCTCDQLTAAVKGFLILETMETENSFHKLRSKEDERALAILERDTKLVGDRYETSLLWKFDEVRMPCNKAVALKRYACLKQKMRRDPELAAMIRSKMNEYIEKEYIRRMSPRELTKKQDRDWYLPIFPVTNPNKPGKIRMVFDAAAKVNGVSLNSFLLTGPDLLAGLLSVLLKFREFKIAVVCEMFHRVMMKPEDQRSQMIFWEGDDPDGEPAVYAVTVMTVGAACSPSCAQFVKNRNAEQFRQLYPRAVDEHYVDDFLASVETTKEAVQLAKEVKDIHASGGFEIRNWVSNAQTGTNQMQIRAQSDAIVNMNYSPVTEKVLGMWWETSTDSFTFRLSPKLQEYLPTEDETPTKRKVLRTLMSVYDPMGLLGHFLMYLKVLVQEIWRDGHGWDDKLSDRITEKWLLWLRVLPDVTKVRVPRCYRTLTSTWARKELHVFCDASESGMAAVAYLRFEENDVIEWVRRRAWHRSSASQYRDWS